MPYWIGASDANWSNTANWSATSGGSGGAAIPTSSTDAIFDANSNLGTFPNCTVNTGATRACANLTTAGYTGTLTLDTILNVNGTLQIDTSVGIAGSSYFNLQLTANRTLDVATGVEIPYLALTPNANNRTVTLSRSTVVNQLRYGTVTTYNALNITPASGSMTFTFKNGGIIGTVAVTLVATANMTFQFDGSCTVGSNNPRFAGDVKTLSTSTLTVTGTFDHRSNGTVDFTQGTIDFQAGSTYSLAASSTIDFPTTQGSFHRLQAGNNSITTLSSNIAIANELNVGGANNATFNGAFTIFLSGSLTFTTTNSSRLAGTSTINFTGISNASISSTGNYTIDISTVVIDKGSGTLTIQPALLIVGSSAWTVSSGTISHSIANTIRFTNSGTPTITSITGTQYGNVEFTTSGATATINGLLTVLGTITVTLSTNQSYNFDGTHGFTTSGFSHSGNNTTITFKSGITYNVTSSLSLIGVTNRVNIRASDFASFTGTANGTTLTYSSGTIPTVGMTVSQASGLIPTGFANLLPSRPVINGGSSPNFTLDLNVSPTTGSIALRAGVKTILTLTPGASQVVAYVTTNDIDSSFGATILNFDGRNDNPGESNPNQFRTLNWGPLVAPSQSQYSVFG